MTAELLLKTVAQHYSTNRPFVVYSRPINNLVKCWLQQDDTLHITDSFEESGFAFSPFKLERGAVIFPKDKCIHHVVTTDDFMVEASDESVNLFSDKKREHLELIAKGKEAINTGNLTKVVLSRRQSQHIDHSNPLAMFKRLFNTYNNAMVYCWYHPKVGLWLGATPELLFKIEGRELTTISLAGTKEYNDDIPVNWTSKEKTEQKIVTDYITSGLDPYVERLKISDVETVRAGQLLHLKTRIIAQIKRTTSLKDLVKTLHPTPAVCGFPKHDAMNFILTHEGYDREYYTGFLGELNLKVKKTRNPNRRNIENNAYALVSVNSNFYVNLRCMQITKNEIIVYVGGGITKDSEVEKEWEETVAKSKTILKVL
ncbi:MAG: chorismate-binding protein [Bacteroidia bacterium]|nr:chorismate-binding protein [Bacteroidia bacterium]NNF86394.1 isochorismate synthase [Winogradskyella sp.]NNL82568.1 isochorismate synthase [Winogradskyella sp.]